VNRSVRDRRPRIVIDARPLSHPQAGGFRGYLRSLIRGMNESDETAGWEILLYLDRPLSPEVAATLPPGVDTRILDTDRLRTDLRLFREQVRRDAPDLVHGTMNYLPPGLGVPTTLTVHDAMGIKKYDWDAKTPRNLRERLINRYWAYLTMTSARAARRIVTVSRGAAQEISETLRLPESRLAVVYNGVTLPPPRAVPERRQNDIMAIASPDPRKNLSVLYRALGERRNRFSKTPPRLLLVCSSMGAGMRAFEETQRCGISAIRLDPLDDRSLSRVYHAMTVFVWPSLMEGFGLPPLEAMSAGCPVLSSSAPVMPEVLGDVPVYFDPQRPDELADRLAALLANPKEREERGCRGHAHAATFTCRRMAEETMAVWRDALEGRNP
jgi:glycosyltransferase involved in cell wall biosynthesis